MKNKMLNYVFLAGLAGLMLTTHTGCKKDDGTDDKTDAALTRTEILTSGTAKWYISSYLTKVPGSPDVQAVDRSKPCRQDDAKRFTAADKNSTSGDAHYVNPVPCGGGEDVDGAKDGWGWVFLDGTKKFGFEGLNYTINKWTKDEIVLYQASYHDISGDSIRAWMTMKPMP